MFLVVQRTGIQNQRRTPPGKTTRTGATGPRGKNLLLNVQNAKDKNACDQQTPPTKEQKTQGIETRGRIDQLIDLLAHNQNLIIHQSVQKMRARKACVLLTAQSKERKTQGIATSAHANQSTDLAEEIANPRRRLLEVGLSK
jgi:hypothetical protein